MGDEHEPGVVSDEGADVTAGVGLRTGRLLDCELSGRLSRIHPADDTMV